MIKKRGSGKKKIKNKGLSQIVSILLILFLVLIVVGIIWTTISSILKKSAKEAEVRTKLIDEGLKIRKVTVNPLSPGIINLTICCAAGISSFNITQSEQKILDIELILDRSGSMVQSGWTANIDSNLFPLNNFQNINVPSNGYSSSSAFILDGSKNRLLIYLNWSKKEGYNGSEASEFALNLQMPNGTWIYGGGNGQPSVLSGKVDPPNNIGMANDYFSGISTKPQMIEVENPVSGTWNVKVYGWNLRPRTSPPNSQEVNISVFYGNSSQISRNPTILSMDAAKNSSKNFVNSKNDDEQMGYIVFGSYANITQSLTLNKNLLLQAIENTGQQGGTEIQYGIGNATNDLLNNGRENSDKVIVLLTDGQNDDGPQVVINTANQAKSNNITIFTIGLTNFVDQEMLTEIATKPEYYHYVPDVSNLEFIFDEIRAKLNQMTEYSLLSDYFKLVFYNETASYSMNLVDDDLMPLETKTYTIDLNGHLENPTKLEIYPIIILDGEEIIGILLDTYYFN